MTLGAEWNEGAVKEYVVQVVQIQDRRLARRGEMVMVSTENPYASPSFDSRAENVEDRPPFSGRIVASITYDADFYVECLQRYRRQHRERRFLLVLKGFAFIICVPGVPVLLWQGEISPALLVTVASLLLFFVANIQDWLARRSFQQSPFRDDLVTAEFTELGYHSTSSKVDVKFQWCDFTKVVHFQDGFLLFPGPRMFIWVPVCSIVDPTQVQELERLLAAKVAEHKVVEQVALPTAALPLIS